MAVADAMTETIRIRIEPDKKAALTRMYAAKKTNVSQVVRDFLEDELASQADPLDRFDAIMTSTDAKLEAYNAPEPTIEDIAAYVEKARAQRSHDSMSNT